MMETNPPMVTDEGASAPPASSAAATVAAAAAAAQPPVTSHISHAATAYAAAAAAAAAAVRRGGNGIGAIDPHLLFVAQMSNPSFSSSSPSLPIGSSSSQLSSSPSSNSNSSSTGFNLHQHMEQLLQARLMEQRNHRIMFSENERQQLALLQLQAQQKKVKEDEQTQHSPMDHQESEQERMRLEILKQKSSQEQSAVASPEVKRHLQEFVLQKKRKEAAASMGNLKLVPASPVIPPQPILRKTASESNLLKIKKGPGSKRFSGAPYPVVSSASRHPVIPETCEGDHVVLSKSQNNSPPIELGSPSSVKELRQQHSGASSANSSQGSAPTSPKTLQQQLGQRPQLSKPQRSLDLLSSVSAASTLNSKSLPNIPSAVSRLVGKESSGMLKRRSPPPSVNPRISSGANSGANSVPHHGGVIVRRSKSSAILPLRKHLIEKSLQEKKHTMDEEQFYYHQKQIDRERLTIRPIEEVMEEDQRQTESGGVMEVDDDDIQAISEVKGKRMPSSFTARLGPSGLSPLVRSEVVGSTNYGGDYVSRLLPRQPLDLVVGNSSSSSSNRIDLQTQDQTGLGYDPLMLRHHCRCEKAANHPENPCRVLVIWNRLVETGLADRCVRVARRATLEEIQCCHSETHTIVYGTDMVNNLCSLTGSQELYRETRMGKFCQLECGGVGVDSDTYWNELETPAAVKMAVGTLIELSQKVCRGELRNGFAIIRPPGHHAEPEEAMGFCYFNSVAIAAKQLRIQLPHLARRVLIIDWAIHHGNGTQKVFYDDPNILYISLHRHDNGNFYPGTGSPVECGSGPGLGFNVNISWSGNLDPPMGDAEYLAAFRAIVMPIARQFDPDIVLVSAGFDAATGHAHPIGGYLVSTACFAYLTLQLRQLARGKVVLALEGGFNLDVIAEASEQCVRALLGMPIEKISEQELARRPSAPAAETIQKTLAIHSPYWETLRKSHESALLSHLEAWEKSRTGENEALNAMASLSVDHQPPQVQGH